MLLDPYSAQCYFNGVFYFTGVQLKNSTIAGPSSILIFILLPDGNNLKLQRNISLFSLHKDCSARLNSTHFIAEPNDLKPV